MPRSSNPSPIPKVWLTSPSQVPILHDGKSSQSRVHVIFYSNDCFDDVIVLEGPSSMLITRLLSTLRKCTKDKEDVTLLETPPICPSTINRVLNNNDQIQ